MSRDPVDLRREGSLSKGVPMNEPAIELKGLTKIFPSEKKALDHVSLTVKEGSVFGFLGPNGAGKTTALRILAGLAEPTSGSASIFGHDATRDGFAARSILGYLPDVPGFYRWMTARQFLCFAADTFGLAGPPVEQRIDELLELASLGDEHGKIGGYSRGMKQRLGVVQALINSPRLLMLDEPTSALDPLGRKELLDLIGSLRGHATVFFSTHILSDVERVCDTVGILNRGRLVTQASIESLKTRYSGHRIVVDVNGGGPAFKAALEKEPWVDEIEQQAAGSLFLKVLDLDEAQHAIPRIVSGLGVGMRRMDVEAPSLEEVFVRLTGEETP
jgi:ABC-2 type transport system ATP-binding protein